MAEVTTLDWGGQRCQVVITKRDSSCYGCDRVFVTFKSDPHYGTPSLELSEMRRLLARMEMMAE